MVEKINITFLGTSQAVPTSRRNHTSILLRYKSENILVDCGEGTQRQFRKAKLNPCKITKILVTHWHGDHILGIPGLLQTLLLNGYQKQLEIYGPKGTAYYMNNIIKIFVPYNTIKIKIHEVNEGVFFENEDFFITAEPMKHSIPINAYSITEKEKTRLNKNMLKKFKIPNTPLLGELAKGKDIEINGKKIKAKEFLYKEQGRKITIILDTALNENCFKIAKDSNILISEAVYLENEKELASLHEHLTASQAGQIAKKSGKKIKALYLSHLSQRYDGNEKSILNEAKKHFKNTIIAEDLMSVEI
jgi:ribonuclease Z